MIYLLLIPAYLMGSIPVGLLAGKSRGIDLRKHGSGNIGATNALRVLGKRIGIGVFLADFSKGFIPVLLTISLVQFPGMNQSMVIPFIGKYAMLTSQFNAQLLQVMVAFAAIVGHNFPIWLKFKGGKGIATTAGVLCALMPVGVLILLIFWSLLFLTTRYVSVASIGAAAILPPLVLYGSYSHGKLADGTWNKALLGLSIVMAAMAIWKHRSNIQRLRAGTENRAFNSKKSSLEQDS